jgi:hypothetical protein
MLSPKPSNRSLIASAALVVSLGLSPFLAAAQSQGDNASVADAARRAREQRKAAAKPVRTLTNDDLPSVAAEPGVSAPAIGAAGETAPADQAKTDQAKTDQAKTDQAKTDQPKTEGASSDRDLAAAPAPVADSDAANRKRAKLAAAWKRAKAELSQAQGELDVLERKAVLDSDTFYSKTDYASDSEGKARLDAEAGQINQKKSEVDGLKAKLAELEAALGQAAEPEKAGAASPD